MSTKNLLVELFVEELPPKALKKLGDSFGKSLFKGLEEHDFLEPDSTLTIYASPRRLAAHITSVLGVSREKNRRVKLMPASVGLDVNGLATPALIKKLMSSFGYHDQVNFESIIKERVTKEIEDKKEVLYHTDIAPGSQLFIRLEGALEDAIDNLPIPKVMTYQLADGWESVKFVRPAHGLLVLHGSDPIKIRALGLESGTKITQGHRFEAKTPTITIENADSYAKQLENEGAVIASFEERRTEIARQLDVAASKEGLKPIVDDALLDEVTALVERPNVLLGQFETEYLEVPQECLILTMKANQKYFPLLDANNKLTNKFLIVSNISPADPSAVIGGNERVVRPRLADAKFFFDQDRKKTLESRLPGLDKVVYHNKLGSQGKRIQRVRAIAQAIGYKLGGENLAIAADKTAMLAKADLLTDMVSEFPELQGIMGSYYAKHDGLGNEISEAIEDHYKPRFSGDDLPRNQVGICVALADKLETLVGMFGIGNIPTGDKDPFALRRHALGVIRILVDGKLDLELDDLLNLAYDQLTGADALEEINQAGGATSTIFFAPETPTILSDFFYERLSGYLRELGYSPQEIEAVLALRPQRLTDIASRLSAVHAFSSLAEAPALAAANKRVGNILKKVEGEIQSGVKSDLLQEPAEIALNEALAKVKPEADKAFESGDYTASLQALAALKTPVDDFFDGVMVNAEDKDLRANRLALLSQLHQAMNRVADLSKLAS